MSKLFFFAVIISVFAVSLAEVEVSTKLSVLDNGSTVLGLNGRPKKLQRVALTKDDGFSNWGDSIYKQRQDNDVLLLRDLVIYPVTSSRDQQLKYTASFRNVRSITSVRFINVGRERAQAVEIDVSSNGVEIYFTLPAETDPRVFVEVYGFQ